jgi:hypothetical protein
MTVPPRLAPADRPMIDLLHDADLRAFEAPGYRGQPGAHAFQDAAHGTTRKAQTFVEFLAPLRGRGDRGLLEVQAACARKPFAISRRRDWPRRGTRARLRRGPTVSETVS